MKEEPAGESKMHINDDFRENSLLARFLQDETIEDLCAGFSVMAGTEYAGKMTLIATTPKHGFKVGWAETRVATQIEPGIYVSLTQPSGRGEPARCFGFDEMDAAVEELRSKIEQARSWDEIGG